MTFQTRSLFTAGKVKLVAKPGSANLPFLSIHNDPDPSDSLPGRLVYGGYIGALEFEDTTNDSASLRHGINLYGVTAMRFGPMFSAALKGDLFHIESQGTATTADRWHVFACIFEAATTWNTDGWTFNNNSVSQVFGYNHIGQLWNMFGQKGLFSGPGAGNVIEGVSCYQNRGFALNLVPDVGTVQRIVILSGELDAPEYGILLDGVQFADIAGIRITHRYEEDAIPANTAWPLVALRLGGTTAGTVTTDNRLQINHRIAPSITPTTQSALGTFSSFENDATVFNNDVSHTRSFSITGVTIAANRFYENAASTSGNIVRLDNEIVHDTRIKNFLHARMVPGATIPVNIGFGTATSKLAYSSVVTDNGGNYDNSSYQYTVPVTGLYAVRGRFMLAIPDGQWVQLAIVSDMSDITEPNIVAAVAEARFIANGVDNNSADSLPQTFEVEFVGVLPEKAKIFVSAIQTTGTPVAISGGIYGEIWTSSFTVVLLTVMPF